MCIQTIYQVDNIHYLVFFQYKPKDSPHHLHQDSDEEEEEEQEDEEEEEDEEEGGTEPDAVEKKRLQNIVKIINLLTSHQCFKSSKIVKNVYDAVISIIGH